MKNKKITVFILLTLCIVIWGTIGWKVYSALRDNAPVAPQVSKSNPEKEKDSPALLLNYRDPFLGEYDRTKEKENKPDDKPAIRTEMYMEGQEEVLPDFQYKGNIRLGKTTQAIVNRNGQSLMLKLNDNIGEFRILQITDSKLVVSRKNKKYELSIQ